MNPFEELFDEKIVHEMTRSQSFSVTHSDLWSSGCFVSPKHTQITSLSAAIENNPARMPDFLGLSGFMNKPTQKLETVYENSSSSQLNQPHKEQQSSEIKNVSVHGSVSSWHLG